MFERPDIRRPNSDIELLNFAADLVRTVTATENMAASSHEMCVATSQCVNLISEIERQVRIKSANVQDIGFIPRPGIDLPHVVGDNIEESAQTPVFSLSGAPGTAPTPTGFPLFEDSLDFLNTTPSGSYEPTNNDVEAFISSASFLPENNEFYMAS